SERMSMKRSFLRSAVSLIALFCFAATARAQRPREPEVVYPPQLLSDLAALRDAALSSDYAYQQVAHLTENIGPRMGASPQAEHAVDYVAEQMRLWCLEVRMEEVRLPRGVRGIETA